MQHGGFEYTPRNSEATVLYSVVVAELETFLATQQKRDRSVPRFVEQEFRSFLDCGVWRGAFCAFVVAPADTTGSCRFRAKAAFGVHRVVDGAWRIPLRIW